MPRPQRKRANNVVEKKGVLYARVRYTDSTGKQREIYRRAQTRAHAKDLAHQIRQEIKIGGDALLDGSRMTFAEVAKRYERIKLVPAVIAQGRKVAGMRTHKDAQSKLKILTEYFGKQLLHRITFNHLEAFKLHRLLQPVQRTGAARTIATVNRELQLLRAVLYFAERDGLILKNPFRSGKGLISHADEKKRDRILSRDEETRLLAACVGKREHLKNIVIVLLDTGMRSGELKQLEWADVDFTRRMILLRETITKTERARIVGMTARTFSALSEMRNAPGVTVPGAVTLAKSQLVFGIADNFKHAFTSACKVAEIENLRPHDLRHTAITRMIQGGIAIAEVMKISGHTQLTTFARYVNTDEDTANRVATALDRLSQIA